VVLWLYAIPTGGVGGCDSRRDGDLEAGDDSSRCIDQQTERDQPDGSIQHLEVVEQRQQSLASNWQSDAVPPDQAVQPKQRLLLYLDHVPEHSSGR
jgi:hypothetical protein